MKIMEITTRPAYHGYGKSKNMHYKFQHFHLSCMQTHFRMIGQVKSGPSSFF